MLPYAPASPVTREVLVVDDEADLVFTLALGLELAGYRVRSAASGEEALALIDEHEPDAIVLDIRLPGMNGWEVLDLLAQAQRFPRIPVVILSADADAATPSKAEELGCHAYLAKPFSATELSRALKAALGDTAAG